MNARDPNYSPLDPAALGRFAEQLWDAEILPALIDYIAIPAKSPMFDADWATHGHLERWWPRPPPGWRANAWPA